MQEEVENTLLQCRPCRVVWLVKDARGKDIGKSYSISMKCACFPSCKKTAILYDSTFTEGSKHFMKGSKSGAGVMVLGHHPASLHPPIHTRHRHRVNNRQRFRNNTGCVQWNHFKLVCTMSCSPRFCSYDGVIKNAEFETYLWLRLSPRKPRWMSLLGSQTSCEATFRLRH